MYVPYLIINIPSKFDVKSLLIIIIPETFFMIIIRLKLNLN